MSILSIPILAGLCAIAPAQEPAPHQIDGLTGVSIDVHTMSAKVIFNLEARRAEVSATMVFSMIGQGGMPLFDLRQDIVSATLDGEEIPVDQLATHDFGFNSGTMRILEREVAAGETHALHLNYLLGKPQSPSSQDIGWGDGTLDWDFFFSDLNQGRYLEMWFPSTLIYDQLAIDLEIEILGTDTSHEMVTNAAVEVIGPLHWKLDFPDYFTALSAMLVIVPSDDVERSNGKVKLPSGKVVHIDVVRRHEAASTMKSTIKQVASLLKDFSKSMGDWPHGDRVTVLVWSGGRSMEYDGATTTSMGALSHELFHSWFARGVKPMSQNDGWWDEAWTVYFADGGRAPKSAVRKEGSPVVLCSSNPWNRTTPGLSYSAGAMLFQRIALEIGEKQLVKHMASFFDKYQLQVASTADLENHLAEESGSEEIHQIFHRYAYGREGVKKE